MEHSPAVCLRLIDDFSQSAAGDHYCSLCLFFGSSGSNNSSSSSSSCDHKPTSLLPRSATPGARSDLTFHTAVSWRSTTSSASSSSSTATLRAPPPPLRRKSSPTQISLRELEAEHARGTTRARELLLLHQQRSEEELRRVYERQMWDYLEGGYASWPEVVERGGEGEQWEERTRWPREEVQQLQQRRWTMLTPVPEVEVEVEVMPPAVPPRAPGRRSREVRFL